MEMMTQEELEQGRRDHYLKCARAVPGEVVDALRQELETARREIEYLKSTRSPQPEYVEQLTRERDEHKQMAEGYMAQWRIEMGRCVVLHRRVRDLEAENERLTRERDSWEEQAEALAGCCDTCGFNRLTGPGIDYDHEYSRPACPECGAFRVGYAAAKQAKAENKVLLERAEAAEQERDEDQGVIRVWRHRCEKAESTLNAIAQWTHEFGAHLCPPGADTYGEGVRDCKQQVADILGKTK